MARTHARRLRQSAGPLPQLSASGWFGALRGVKQRLGEHNLSLVAAGAAFYGLLAIFPALAALVSLYGLFTDPQTVEQHVRSVQSLLPPAAAQLIQQQLTRIVATGGGALTFGAVFGLVLALWSSKKGVSSLMTALNIVYGEDEKRGFVKLNAVALLLTFGLLLFIIVALAAIAFVPAAIGSGVSGPLAMLVSWLRWPVIAAASLVALGVLYRYGPSRENAERRWFTWGAAAATLLWLGGSALFSWYVSSFGSYNETYGSVAAVAVLMIWLWLSAYFVLLGAELDAEMERRREGSRLG